MLAPRPRQRRSPQQVQHRLVTLPAPTGGLNTTGDLASMPPTDSVEQDNLIGQESGLTVRGGWFEYATNINTDATHPVRTVMAYVGAPANAIVSPLAASVLFGATDNGIYNIEGGGNLTALAAAIALSGSVHAGTFTYTMFTPSGGGQYLVACSETDGAFLYNGVTWAKFDTVGSGPGHITAGAGVDPTKWVHVCVWKKQLLFVEQGSTRMWSLDPGLLGGAAHLFDFGSQFLSGGLLLALANWTQDAGAGIDDQLVILSSSGDLVVYSGTDPTNAAKFAQVGIWFIGQPPAGRRCLATTGGNVFVLTVYGLVPVSLVMQGGIDNILTSGTDMLKQLRKLQTTLNQDFQQLLNTDGWELCEFPNLALLQITRPIVASNEFIQYAFQMHSLSWNRMLDVPGITFARRLNEVYAGTADGRVLRVFDGDTDGMLLDGTGAHEIRSRLTPAFNYMGDPSTLKQALMVRLNFLATASPAYQVLMNTDFEVNPIFSAPAVGATVGSLWDIARWDVDFWVGSSRKFQEWVSVVGMGYALSPSLFLATQEHTTLTTIEHMVKPGGPW